MLLQQRGKVMDQVENLDLFMSTDEAKKKDRMRREHDEAKRLAGIQVGKNLAKARRLSGRSQSQVMSEVFHLIGQKNRISEIENGKMPDVDLLQRLCHYYGVSSDWVLGFTAEPDLDHNASRAGILYGNMLQVLMPVVRNITLNLSHIGAKAIGGLPESSAMDLLDTAKALIDHQSKSDISPELANLMHAVRKIEINLAKNNSDLTKHLDDLSDPDNILYSQVIEEMAAKHPNSVVIGDISN